MAVFCKIMNTADYDLPHTAKAGQCNCPLKDRDHTTLCPMYDSQEFPFRAGEIILMERDMARHFERNFDEIRVVEQELDDRIVIKDTDGRTFTIAKDGKMARIREHKEAPQAVEEPPSQKADVYLKPEKAKASAR